MNQKEIPLLSGEIAPTLWKFTFPLMFGFVVNIIYSWTDTYFVSRLGDDAIAAIGFCEQIGFFIFTLGSGFASGSAIIVARRIGESKPDEAGNVAHQSVVALGVASAIIAIILLLTISKILQMLGLQGAVFLHAQQYLSALILGVPANLLMFQSNAIIRSSGNSVFPMRVLLTTTILNAVFAPLFIFGWGFFPALGMFGAGLATASAQWVGMITSLGALFAGKIGLTIPLRFPKINREILKNIIRLGVPSSLQMFSVSASRMAVFAIVNTYGTAITAAYTLGLKVDFFVFMPVFAMGIAMEVITGQHLGAKKVERIYLFYKTAIQHLTLLIVLLGVLAFAFGDRFASIFTADPYVIQHTKSYLHIAVFGYLFFAIAIISTRVISGAGASFLSMFIIAGSILGIQLPAAYYMSRYSSWGDSGVWFGLLFGYVVLAIIAFWNYQRRMWLKVHV